MTSRKKLVIFTGSGVSAESGINTFRDHGGLWEGYDVMEVASPIGWHNDPRRVLDFYNQRRAQLLNVQPNSAHIDLVSLEEHYQTIVITQNVDDLHERAGSSHVIHLHGELCKVRSTIHPEIIYEWKKDLKLGDTCEKGYQLRPHVVWFGEEVPELSRAIQETQQADLMVIIGTSLQVYPAASLVEFAPDDCKIFYIDPKPFISYALSKRNKPVIIQNTATKGVNELLKILI